MKDVDPTTGRKTVNHYELFQKLGSGQHGTVKLARNMDTGEDVAIKIVRRFSKKLRFGKSGDPNDMIKREVAILKKARHRHVVSLIEVIDDAEFGKVYLVLEFVKRGEIVWRKRTDKDVALFEMERTKREAAHGFNFEFEKMAIEEFNAGAPLRRHGKKQNLEDRKYEEKERYHAAGSGSFDPYFSLEFGGESEDENGSGFLRQIEAQHQRHSLKMGTTDISSQSDTPTDTPKPIPHSIDSEHLPVSVPSSRPQTPASFGGTMWGSYPEQNHSDMALQAMLNEIIAAQTNWDEIDENYRYVPCLTLHHALDAFRDTVLGLEFLHFQGIIHRDIKPANLLWTSDYRVKISDFGVSYLGRPIREDDNNEEIAEADPANLDEAIELAKTVGTPAFYAPELCDPQYFVSGEHQERPAITGQIDVWALGVTLYGMIFGRLPFFHTNEFKMYEKIARDEVFIPKMRLKGVPHAPSANALGSTRFGIKRLDDVLEYEEVSDELRDLLKRLLEKHPSKRITLKEVKHHPWMLQGIDDHAFWIDSTDPSLQSEGRKIEVSTQEVQDAVGGLNVMDRIKNSFQRVSSVLRGRGPRKRGESSAKAPEYASRTPAIKDAASPRDERRTSLRGDEQILPALRASREGSEHPLAQSVTASPEMKNNLSYFDDGGDAVRPASEPQSTRPVLPDRTLSTADSMKTIRAPAPAAMRNNVFSPQTYEEFSTLTTVVDPVPSSASSLGGVFAGAGRRFVNSMRSQERGAGRQSPSQTSRSSSVGTGTDDPHASPSLALSSAIAAGHVDQPPVLREEFEMHHLPNEPTSEEFMHSQGENYRRQTLEHARRRRPSVFTSPEAACPTSPDDEIFFAQRRPGSVSDSTSAFAISSSSDQIVSGESTANSRIPSVVSGASSLSATVEKEDENGLALEKSISPYTIGRRSDSYSRILMESTDHNPRPETTLTPSVAQAAADDDAGYNGDSDSDDEGLAMA